MSHDWSSMPPALCWISIKVSLYLLKQLPSLPTHETWNEHFVGTKNGAKTLKKPFPFWDWRNLDVQKWAETRWVFLFGKMNPILTTHIFSGWVGKKNSNQLVDWWWKKIGSSNLGDNNHHRNLSGPILVFTNLRELLGGFSKFREKTGKSPTGSR